MNSQPSLQNLESTLGYKFKDLSRLNQALIHRSYLNENRAQVMESNERYEFLGDAVLELWVSKYLFDRFPDFKEGNLTNLRALIVCTQSLAKIAKSFDLGSHIHLSKGEELNNGRDNQSILADTFESIIGAIYLDGGTKAADKFLSRFLIPEIDILSSQKVYKDKKSLFQEIAQAQTGITPHYATISESGPDHKKTFEVGVYIGEKLIATGTGSSKQSAEADASDKAVTIFEKQPSDR